MARGATCRLLPTRPEFTGASPGRPDITNRPHIGLRYRRQGNMPTFVYMTRCDASGRGVDICPSDLITLDPPTPRPSTTRPKWSWGGTTCGTAGRHFALNSRG